MASRKKRKQRKRMYNAPHHRKRRIMSAHLSSRYLEDTKKVYPRAVPVRKGDTVRVIRGDDKGEQGKVASVDRKSMTIAVEGITHAKADGSQVAKKIHPSNVIIAKLDLSDPLRRKKLEERGGSE